MQLFIANKNYSSWSMRPWVLMRQTGIAFDEVMVRFDSMAADAPFKQRVLAVSPAGRVPVLVDGPLVVWDSLAIAETLAELHPHLGLWPRDAVARAHARSICAEMHAGFSAMRTHCVMNIEASLPEVGARLLAEQPAVRAELERIVQMWRRCLQASGGPFLFGSFGIADAYYAPVVARVRTYALPLPDDVAAYAARLWATHGVQAWVADALQERTYVPEDEPYRQSRD